MIDRQSIYKALFKLKESGEDVSSQLKIMETVSGEPKEIIDFLRDKSPQFQFYRYIHKYQKALSKSILDYDELSDIDKIIACSSFITRIYLSIKFGNISEVLLDELNIQDVIKSLDKAIRLGDFSKMNEVMKLHSNSLRLFYSKNK